MTTIAGFMEPVIRDPVHKAGDSLGKGPSADMHSHKGSLEMPIHLIQNPENPSEAYTKTRRTCRTCTFTFTYLADALFWSDLKSVLCSPLFSDL